MRFSRTQTSRPRLSERSDTCAVAVRSELLRRRALHGELEGSGVPGGRGGIARHLQSLHETRCTGDPCPILWALARFFLTEEAYSDPIRSRCSSNAPKRSTGYRPVKAQFPRTVDVRTCAFLRAIPASLHGAAHLSHAPEKRDRRAPFRDEISNVRHRTQLGANL